jgi:hypothetical protein
MKGGGGMRTSEQIIIDRQILNNRKNILLKELYETDLQQEIEKVKTELKELDKEEKEVFEHMRDRAQKGEIVNGEAD